MIHETGSINMTVSPGCPHTIRTKNIIQKINSRLKRKKRVSSRKLPRQLELSIRRVWRNHLGLRPYKQRIVPLMTDTEKLKRKKFANLIRTNFKKEGTFKILFSDEKIYDIDEVCNA